VRGMLVRPDLCTLGHIIHGGASWPLRIRSALPPPWSIARRRQGHHTIGKQDQFHRGGEGTTLIATGRPVHRGPSYPVWQTRLRPRWQAGGLCDPDPDWCSYEYEIDFCYHSSRQSAVISGGRA